MISLEAFHGIYPIARLKNLPVAVGIDLCKNVVLNTGKTGIIESCAMY